MRKLHYHVKIVGDLSRIPKNNKFLKGLMYLIKDTIKKLDMASPLIVLQPDDSENNNEGSYNILISQSNKHLANSRNKSLEMS